MKKPISDIPQNTSLEWQNNLNIDDGTACVGTETHGHTHTKKEYCYR